ncbi:hypothetical protein ACE6H2_002301 [Prunus campanulata]
MSDKASCSGATNIRPLALELEDPKPEADTAAKEKEDTDLSKLDMPPPLLALCQHFRTKLLPGNEALTIHMPKEVFGFEHDTFLFTEDVLQFGSMVEIGTIVISFDKKKDKLQYKQEDIDEVRHEWAEFVNKQLPKDN